MTPVPSGLSSPFFTPTPEDSARLSKLTHELDNRALNCLDAVTCEHAHFARALVSLFENQEAARASFRRAIEDNPSGTLAASSVLWLQLIGDQGNERNSRSKQQNVWNDLVAQLVRDRMARELREHAKQEKPGELNDRQTAISEPSDAVQALKKEVRERDRHIAMLQSKLDALKVIDQDHAHRKRAIRLPATLP